VCCSLVLLRFRKLESFKTSRKAARERKALDKVSKSQARAASKVQKDLEAQQKRENRAIRAEARKTEEALTKARREQAKAARNAQKQLETGSKTSQKRPGGRPPKQKKPRELSATMIEPVEEMASVQPKSRNERIIRKPAHFDGIRIEILVNELFSFKLTNIELNGIWFDRYTDF
jgi:ATPase subunit of ABC transporter with duplicated ATPase domains